MSILESLANISIHSTKSSRLHPNICGLQTSKNCSYMSAALQCLIHTEPLRMFILRNKGKLLVLPSILHDSIQFLIGKYLMHFQN